ncbi:MAG: histidine phosphatase family protein, partial [Armatimonadota bacterium]|nr:histidine phosphatase family protein [Armatimonadota bacterium]
EEVQKRFPEAYARWRADSLRHRPPGGETIEALHQRAAAVFDRVLARHAGECVALVTHGGPIRILVLHALGAPLSSYPCLSLANASLTLIEVSPEGPLLTFYNLVPTPQDGESGAENPPA